MGRADKRGGFGAGAQVRARLPRAGWKLGRMVVRRVMPVTDPGVAPLGHPERIAGLIGDEGTGSELVSPPTSLRPRA